MSGLPDPRPVRRLRAVSRRRRAEKTARVRAEFQEALEFKLSIGGDLCAMCGRSEMEALEQTGYGHEAHHAIRQQVLRRRGLSHLVWDTRLAVALCEEPCHRRHTSRKTRLPFDRVPSHAYLFAREHDLVRELETEHPL